MGGGGDGACKCGEEDETFDSVVFTEEIIIASIFFFFCLRFGTFFLTALEDVDVDAAVADNDATGMGNGSVSDLPAFVSSLSDVWTDASSSIPIPSGLSSSSSVDTPWMYSATKRSKRAFSSSVPSSPPLHRTAKGTPRSSSRTVSPDLRVTNSLNSPPAEIRSVNTVVSECMLLIAAVIAVVVDAIAVVVGIVVRNAMEMATATTIRTTSLLLL
mmetsp:Transcript_43010/g.50312  ORF Transcript_43010/g.50312 Transcript_43010/m.50312 type:complete len:215 (+) Transcript_43010:964-1608(+)